MMRTRLALQALALAATIRLVLPGAVGAMAAASSRPVTPQVARSHLAVIVNKSNPVVTVGRRELRALFLGDRPTWATGRRVTLALREPGQPERAAALRLIYGMSEADLTRHFLHQTFTGNTSAGPRTLATADGVKRFVFNVPGAIGLVRLADVDDTVKTVQVNGVAPGDAAYALVMGES